MLTVVAQEAKSRPKLSKKNSKCGMEREEMVINPIMFTIIMFFPGLDIKLFF